MTKRFLSVAMIACAAFAGACGDSTVPNTPLTDAQVDELVDAMAAAGFMPTAPSAAAQGSAALISMQIDQNVECPVSGSVHVTGSWSVNDTFSALTANVKQKHQACAATSEKTGKTWTFNGRPDVSESLTVNVTNQQTGAGTLTGTQKGAIGFATDGLEGTCHIDVTITATQNDAGVTSGTLTGTVCGKDVSQEFTNTSGV